MEVGFLSQEYWEYEEPQNILSKLCFRTKRKAETAHNKVQLILIRCLGK